MRYYVSKIEACSRCNGVGVVQHPAWERYWEETRRRGRPTNEEYTQWWQNEGYDPRQIPGEEIECPDCDGLGRIEVRVPLEEALRELKK